jgi:hypothetical protein
LAAILLQFFRVIVDFSLWKKLKKWKIFPRKALPCDWLRLLNTKKVPARTLQQLPLQKSRQLRRPLLNFEFRQIFRTFRRKLCQNVKQVLEHFWEPNKKLWKVPKNTLKKQRFYRVLNNKIPWSILSSPRQARNSRKIPLV